MWCNWFISCIHFPITLVVWSFDNWHHHNAKVLFHFLLACPYCTLLHIAWCIVQVCFFTNEIYHIVFQECFETGQYADSHIQHIFFILISNECYILEKVLLILTMWCHLYCLLLLIVIGFLNVAVVAVPSVTGDKVDDHSMIFPFWIVGLHHWY